MDPDDPMLIAENELLGAAESIERAAKKLASLKPRREVKGKVGTDFVFKKNPSYKLYHPVSAHRCDMTLE